MAAIERIERKLACESVTIKVEKCGSGCPYFGIDGGPGSVMICSHSQGGYVIDSGGKYEGMFPEKCPLKK